MPKPTVGLTGGIACGKSTIAGFFRDLGIPVVDADAIAREVVAKSTPAYAEILARFGSDIVDPSGEIDRKRLGERVFGDEPERRALNAITHPRIAELSAARIAALQDGVHPYVIYEAALLIENSLQEAFGALVVAATKPAVQRSRLMARDGIDETAAAARIASQLPVATKVAAADHVIWNDGSLEDCRARTLEVHKALALRFATKGG